MGLGLKASVPYRCRIISVHIRDDPECEPSSSVSIRVGPWTSGNVLSAAGGQHGSFMKFKTAVLV
ncbi:hypothetical protein DPMN_070440 [Dreissena polymorpha]|uniref:Uncharacterized protein n=1 Tax=Dreissena polymorpha TaxID=45954 RepID=A0A9D4BVN1_DREPO|nr:hypothetical protein DPMN_070440 [Dreissena polymorpha]